ncbi:hypothetical protein ACP70R_026503 [Stipagrostis hirtigluma subsp. patula]
MSSALTYQCLLRDHYKQQHHSSMCSLSSPGQLKFNTTTTVLLAVFILTLYITCCEARHLRVHGEHSSKVSSSPPKGVIDVGTTKGQMKSSPEVPVRSNMDASMGKDVVAKAKEVASSGGVRNARVLVRVSQRLPHHEHRGDQEFHLDYAQPRTHTPCHNR